MNTVHCKRLMVTLTNIYCCLSCICQHLHSKKKRWLLLINPAKVISVAAEQHTLIPHTEFYSPIPLRLITCGQCVECLQINPSSVYYET